MKIVDNNEDKKSNKNKYIIIGSVASFLILFSTFLYFKGISRASMVNDNVVEIEQQENYDLEFLKDEDRQIAPKIAMRTALTAARESQKTPIANKEDVIKNVKYFYKGIEDGYNLDEIYDTYNDLDFEYHSKYLDMFNFVSSVNDIFDGADVKSENPALFFTGISKMGYTHSKNIPPMEFELSARESVNPYNTSDFLYYTRYMIERAIWTPGAYDSSAEGMYNEMEKSSIKDFVNLTSRNTDINSLPLTGGIEDVLRNNITSKDLENYQVIIPMFTDSYSYNDIKSKFVIPMYNKENKQFVLGIYDNKDRLINIEIFKEKGE